MDKKQTLTNEELSKKFKSNFDLVNYTISLAEDIIKSGKETRVKSDLQNRAMLILEEAMLILEVGEKGEVILDAESIEEDLMGESLEEPLLEESAQTSEDEKQE